MNRDVCIYVEPAEYYCKHTKSFCSNCFMNCSEYKFRKLERVTLYSLNKNMTRRINPSCELCWQRFECWTN